MSFFHRKKKIHGETTKAKDTENAPRRGEYLARIGSGVLVAALLAPNIASVEANARQIGSPQAIEQELPNVETITESSDTTDAFETASPQVEVYKEAAFSYEEGAFAYSREQTTAVTDMELKIMEGLPYAWSASVYHKKGIDETATKEQKIEAFLEGMKDCYTKNPYALASLVLLRSSRMGGPKITDESILALGDTYKDNPEQWQEAYEAEVGPIFAKDSVVDIGHVEAGTHGSFYDDDGAIVFLPTSQYESDTLSVTYRVTDESGVEWVCTDNKKPCTQPVIEPDETCEIRELPPEEELSPPVLPVNPIKPENPFVRPAPDEPPLVPLFRLPQYKEPAVLPKRTVVVNKDGTIGSAGYPGSQAGYLGKNGRPPKTIGAARAGHGQIAEHIKEPSYESNARVRVSNRKGNY
ncbi:hypothetical protein EOL96_04770 [Candidatus Saccharibacteria bacterium]|nr:hypothetical protein [Candidatus Saccharibacteria bacterium]